MGFPLPGECRTTTSLPQFLSKSGNVSAPVLSRTHFLEECGSGEPRSVPKIPAPGDVSYRGAQRRGTPSWPGPLQLLLLDPSPWPDLASPRPALPAAAPYALLSAGNGARLRVDFHAEPHSAWQRGGRAEAAHTLSCTAAAKGRRTVPDGFVEVQPVSADQPNGSDLWPFCLGVCLPPPRPADPPETRSEHACLALHGLFLPKRAPHVERLCPGSPGTASSRRPLTLQAEGGLRGFLLCVRRERGVRGPDGVG